MFEKYQEEVLAYYKRRQQEPDFSLNLINPTAKSIKSECLAIYSERPSLEDEKILKFFFGGKITSSNYAQIIDETKLGSFRSMLNLMNGTVPKPRRENIELLAWLVDFNPRPYTLRDIEKRNLTTIINEKNDVKTVSDTTSSTPTVLPPTTTTPSPDKGIKWTHDKLRNAVLAFTILIVAIGTGTYFTYKKGSELIFNPTLTGKEQCMYWTGDQYRPISCNQQVEGVVVLALDPAKVSQLKKITRPDTLTKFSIGKVWWGKINGKVDFYTAGGEHPEDNRKRLLPMSAYMLNKYVIKE